MNKNKPYICLLKTVAKFEPKFDLSIKQKEFD